MDAETTLSMFLSKKYVIIVTMLITLASTINPNRPKVTSKWGFVGLYLQNLTYVIITLVVAHYYNVELLYSMAAAYFVGRFGYLLDSKVIQSLTNLTFTKSGGFTWEK